MKRFFVFTFIILFTVLFNITIGAYYEKNENIKILRIQTVAASDSDFDQYIKYEISSAVDSYISKLFDLNSVSDISEAVEVVKNNIGKIRALCVEVARGEDCVDPIFVKLVGVEQKRYSSAQLLNDQIYPVLRIGIGEGLGHNCQKIIWSDGPTIEKNVAEELTISGSVFPSEVKFDFWIVGMMKKIISSFE